MKRRPLYVPLFWLLVAVLGIAGFWYTGSLHGSYRQQYVGVRTVPASEMVLYAWYGLFSFVTLVGTAALLQLSPLCDRLAALRSHRRWVVFGCAGFVLIGALVFRHFVLLRQPITDDELTYRFIAQTLLSGGVSNTPPIDPDFLWNQFVVAGPGVWYGKYPIGHPLFLAAGELIGLRELVVPVITAGSVLLAHSVGRRLFDDRTALLGSVLMALSPQLVLTGGTELSQPTEMLLMLAGMWCGLRIESDSRLRWAVLAGVAWGGAVLVRPVPGALFLLAAAAAFGATIYHEDPSNRRARWLELAVAGAVAAAIASVVLIVNHAQTGGALDSGYVQLHGAYMPPHSRAQIASSVAAAVLRQSFWLLGAPALIVAIAFARPGRGRVLFWGLIIAEYAYRVIVPKTVVSTTGPIYMLEIVPLLALATADGLFRIAGLVDRLGVDRVKRWLGGVVFGAAVAMLTMFVPVQLENIHGGATARTRVDDHLDRAGVSGASVVFINSMVQPGRMDTWAYFAPNPSPDLSDRRLYLRLPRGEDNVARVRALWLERFADRRAFIVSWDPEIPFIVELKP